jgi:hypothetical protein
MQWLSNSTKRLTAIAVCCFLLAGFLRLATLRVGAGHSGAPLAAMVPTIYVGLLIAWIISLGWRILDGGIRRLLIASACLMVFYMLIRTAKYQFFSNQDFILRHLWYGYYIPMTAIPLLQFLAALRVGRHDQRPMDARWHLLFIPAALLMAGILTNDLHQFAFRFQPGLINWDRAYSRGALYIAVVIWNALLLLSALAVVVDRCRVEKSRKGVWMPFTALLIGAVYMVWGLTEHFASAMKLFQMPEVFCFMFVAFLELSIQVGLIPSNAGHADFFGISTVAAQIVGERGDVFYRSRNAPPLTPAQMAAAANAPILIDPDTRLHSRPIQAGRIYWTDDLTAVHGLNAQLVEIGGTLAEENQLIQVENQIKRQQAQLAEQNRLYDGMARMAASQLDQMAQILSGLTPGAADFSRRIGHACVLNAYIKRRGNLMLIAEDEPAVHAAELSHCIRESMDCLRAYGALCSFQDDARGKLSAEKAMLAYDFFEAVVEAALPGITSLMVHLAAQDGALTLRMSMEDASCRLFRAWRRGALARLGGRMTRQESGGTVFVSLCFKREGEGA